MSMKPRLIERVLDAYRDGDLHECISLVRTLVEAAPQATAPRQLFAALFAVTGNGRQALAHYRRLLPQAVERGEVIRAIAFQKQIDVYELPDALVPGRWGELQKRLRQRGMPFAGQTPGGTGRPWLEAQLLALPRAWFERIAAETRFEIIGLEPRSLDVEAGTVWEVLAGRTRWSFALPDGRASAVALAAEGDAVHVDPGLARNARVSFVPELPVEALRFDATLARDLKLALAAGLQAGPSIQEGITPETRALLPSRPRPRADLDERPWVPDAPEGPEPLRLVPSGEPDQEPPARDTGEWVEFGVLSLGEPPAPPRDPGTTTPPTETVEAQVRDATPAETPDDTRAATPADPPAGEPPEPDLPPLPSRPERPGERQELADLLGILPYEPVPGEPAPTGERAEAPIADEVEASASDDSDFALASDANAPDIEPAAGADEEPVIERRRHPRVVVSLESRLALLRLSGTRVSPVRGQLGDLSTSGFSIRFAGQHVAASRAALADAIVAVDLDLPGPPGALRVAAQVRWLEVDEPGDVARLGVEFVLLTEPDRRRIAGTLARAALAAREAERRKAA